MVNYQNNRDCSFSTEIIREILENRAQTYTKLGEDYDKARVDQSGSEGVTIPTDEGGEGGDSDFVNYQPSVIDDSAAL